MPALDNPRWERFCQLIVFGDIASNKQAYIEAGYKARDNGAEVNACKLLRLTKPVSENFKISKDKPWKNETASPETHSPSAWLSPRE